MRAYRTTKTWFCCRGESRPCCNRSVDSRGFTRSRSGHLVRPDKVSNLSPTPVATTNIRCSHRGGYRQPVGAVVGGFIIAFSEVTVTYAYKKFLGYIVPADWAPEGLAQLLGPTTNSPSPYDIGSGAIGSANRGFLGKTL